MNLQIKTLLQFNKLSLTLSENVLLKEVSGSILSESKIGLIGINGSGKSSLLKCLSGLISSDSGRITKNASVEYVQQIDLDVYKKDVYLYSYIESRITDWWIALDVYESLFGKRLEEDLKIKDLSGGEIVKLNISIALSKSPQILLLDEPTNHLDISSMKLLEEYLKFTKTAFIVVSHNIKFLNNVVDEIWELSGGSLEVYGGNYDFYKQKKRETIEARKRMYEVKVKKKRKLLISARKDANRSERNIKKGKMLHNPGEDKYFKGFFGNKSQKKAGKNKLAFSKKQEEVNSDIKKLETKERKPIYLDLNVTRKRGLLISISDGKLILPNGVTLIENINITLNHEERFAILGNNGSGKTTFVNQLAYEKSSLLSGTIKYGSKYKTLYVDQKYEVVLPQLTLVENLQQKNNEVNYENARRLLSNFGFYNHEDITRKANTLSGGEIARLAFAIATSAMIDVLILDEPTNNLDIETVNVIAEALSKFEGTLIVISHDIEFLKDSICSDALIISQKSISFDNIVSFLEQ